MGYRLARLVGTWWPAAWIVIIGAWKTTEFAASMAGDSRDWLLRAMAGLLFFGPFIAAEMLPLMAGSWLQKTTKTLLFTYLLIALVLQALSSTKTLVNDGMEREHLVRLQESIAQYEGRRLSMLEGVYEQLLRDNACVTKQGRARKNALGCETLWRQYEEVLNTPKTYWIEPQGTDAFRELLRHRLDWLDELTRKLPVDWRVLEYGTSFDFTIREHGTMEILAWTAHNYSQERAQVLISQFCRNVMLLVLTIIVGIWYHATADERKKLLEGPQTGAENR